MSIICEWFSEADKEYFISLKSLINKNEGKFKSEKQYKFFEQRYLNWQATQWEQEQFQGEKYMSLTQVTTWGKEIWEHKDTHYIFTFDEIGIKALYKLPFKTKYISRDSCQGLPLFEAMTPMWKRAELEK